MIGVAPLLLTALPLLHRVVVLQYYYFQLVASNFFPSFSLLLPTVPAREVRIFTGGGDFSDSPHTVF